MNTLRTGFVASSLALSLLLPVAAADKPLRSETLPVANAKEAPLVDVKLASVTLSAKALDVTLNYTATPKADFCVVLAVTDGAVFRTLGLPGDVPGIGGPILVNLEDRTRCLTADSGGKAQTTVRFARTAGKLLASVVVATGEVHTDVISLPRCVDRKDGLFSGRPLGGQSPSPSGSCPVQLVE